MTEERKRGIRYFQSGKQLLLRQTRIGKEGVGRRGREGARSQESPASSMEYLIWRISISETRSGGQTTGIGLEVFSAETIRVWRMKIQPDQKTRHPRLIVGGRMIFLIQGDRGSSLPSAMPSGASLRVLVCTCLYLLVLALYPGPRVWC